MICLTPAKEIFDQQALVERLNMAGLIGVCLFILAHIVATSLGLPGTILVIAGGAVYGLVWGTVWSVIGATLGAIAAFLIARYYLRDWFEARLGQHPLVKRLNHMMCRNDLSCVLTLRFTPITPFNILNFLLGLTPVRLKSYAMGTFLGIIPGTLAYTWLGMSGMHTLKGEGHTQLWVALGLLAGLSVLPILLREYRLRSKT